MRCGIVRVAALLALLFAASVGTISGQSAQEIFRSSMGVLFDGPEPKPATAQPATGQTTTAKPKKTPVVQASLQESGAEQETPKATTVANIPTKVIAGKTERLAMRYRIERDHGDGDWRAVDPNAVFRSGDRIRLAVEANAPAYLYVVNQGSSGRGRMIFPYQTSSGDANAVDPFKTYIVPDPAVGYFRFDDQPGEEKLFVVLTRSREASLDRFLPRIKDEKAPAPAAPRRDDPAWRVARSDYPVESAVLTQLRDDLGASRDLIMERVEEPRDEQGGSVSEIVSYIASRDMGDDARVIVEVTLSHR